jgi:hypothetical protein
MDFQPPASLDAVNEYFTLAWNVISDGKVSAREREQAELMGSKLAPNQMRAVHAQLFRDALQECLIDGEITDAEAEYLTKLRKWLARIGWAP